MDERPDDRDLVNRCRSGSEAAFRELVDRHKNMVFAMLARSTADRSQIEDLAQEVFLRVHRGLARFRGDARLSTWICRIVLNVSATARARAPQEVSLDAIPAGAAPPAAVTVDRSFTDLEMRDRVAKALTQISEQSRTALSMYYFAGRSYEEIADALQMPLGTVKTHLHRAKNELRRVLEGPPPR